MSFLPKRPIVDENHPAIMWLKENFSTFRYERIRRTGQMKIRPEGADYWFIVYPPHILMCCHKGSWVHFCVRPYSKFDEDLKTTPVHHLDYFSIYYEWIKYHERDLRSIAGSCCGGSQPPKPGGHIIGD